MRIVHLSRDDEIDGAGRAAGRLHRGLLGLGHDSRMLVLNRRTLDSTVTKFVPDSSPLARLARKYRKGVIDRQMLRYRDSRPSGLELFADDRTPDAGTLCRQIGDCDILNLHFVSGLVDHAEFFPRLRRDTPVVWRLADMGPLTGGCHYNVGCGRYAVACGCCPQLGSTNPNDLSRQVWRRKKRALDALGPERLHLVAPSTWIAEQARRSSLLAGYPITVIPNGLDVRAFTPHDRRGCRDLLGLPAEATIVLFIASNLATTRKGLSLLVEALGQLEKDHDQLLLVSVGGKAPTGLTLRHKHLGSIGDDRLLAAAYSAADVFVIPSLQESFGQTAIESLACGTPVVGFATGGMLDIIRPGRTGELAAVGNSNALASAVVRALDAVSDPRRRETIAESCREVAVQEYSTRLQARRYEDLYLSLLDRARSPQGKPFSSVPAAQQSKALTKAPRVSVVVPNYNYAHYLDERLQSILGQTFEDFELIIIDDGSTDRSREVISRYESDPRVRTVYCPTNGGSAYRRWNDGARLARGEFLWFAGADDSCAPTFLERLVGVLDAHPKVGLAYCQVWLTDETGRRLQTKTYADSSEHWESDFVTDGREECRLHLSLRCTMPTASSVLMRRMAFREAGPFDLSFRLAADWMLYIRILLRSDVAFIAEPLVDFRSHPGTQRLLSARNRSAIADDYRVARFVTSCVAVDAGRRTLIRDRLLTRFVHAILKGRGWADPRWFRRVYADALRLNPNLSLRLGFKLAADFPDFLGRKDWSRIVARHAGW